jgi:hypothetical protein
LYLADRLGIRPRDDQHGTRSGADGPRNIYKADVCPDEDSANKPIPRPQTAPVCAKQINCVCDQWRMYRQHSASGRMTSLNPSQRMLWAGSIGSRQSSRVVDSRLRRGLFHWTDCVSLTLSFAILWRSCLRQSARTRGSRTITRPLKTQGGAGNDGWPPTL